LPGKKKFARERGLVLSPWWRKTKGEEKKEENKCCIKDAKKKNFREARFVRTVWGGRDKTKEEGAPRDREKVSRK